MSEIEPALTPEEWADEGGGGAVNRGDFMVYAPRGMDGLVVGPPGPGHGVLIPTDLHQATAALCLHGQPFGFTWEDVDALRGLIELQAALRKTNGVPGDGGLSPFARLADRIAALLPPRAP